MASICPWDKVLFLTVSLYQGWTELERKKKVKKGEVGFSCSKVRVWEDSNPRLLSTLYSRYLSLDRSANNSYMHLYFGPVLLRHYTHLYSRYICLATSSAPNKNGSKLYGREGKFTRNGLYVGGSHACIRPCCSAV